MQDGYYTHEVGDSWHGALPRASPMRASDVGFGPCPPRTAQPTPTPPRPRPAPAACVTGQDWDYDELHFSLGAPLSNASAADVLYPHPAPVPPPIPLTEAWQLYVRTPDGSNASWALDPAVRPSASAPASARVDIQGTAASAYGIDLSQLVPDFSTGGYELSFWARASQDATPVHLNARKNGGDWHSLGLDVDVVVSSSWAQLNITFPCAADGTSARLSWWMGKAAPGVSVWVNSPTLVGVAIPPPVFLREFECGAVVLNGDTAVSTVNLTAAAGGLRRLAGQQAPLWQYFVDDASSAFSVVSGAWDVRNYDSGYHGATTPSQEEVRPADGFYHHWAAGAHHALGGSSARFDLQVPVAGTYDVSMWWPAAVPARGAWARAMLVTISPGSVRVTVDLTTQGGDAFFSIAQAVALDPSSTLTVSCPAGGGDCIADAVLVESAARWNDGSATTTVVLQPMDAIILNRTAGAPAHCNAAAMGGT